MIVFRTMTMQDIEAGLRLCRLAGWNQLARDWEIFLRLSPDKCRVALKEGLIAGTVTTINYQHAFNWIGMVLVDPQNRRQGIGSALLQEALEILDSQETVKLDATPAGREVYLKMNFIDEYPLHRMHMRVSNIPGPESKVRAMDSADWPQVLAMDQLVFGADREPLLRWVWQGAPDLAFCEIGENGLNGFCFGRRGHDHTQIGPVIAKDIRGARSLLLGAMGNCTGRSVILDAMNIDPDWSSWLKETGFAELRILMRMYRGNNNSPGIPEKQYAILGPEFG